MSMPALRGIRWLEDLASDTRFALRAMLHSPGIACAAIVTLALGVGANAAIFSAVDAVILRPLPFTAAGRLVMLGEENPDRGWHAAEVAPANFLDWTEQVHAFVGTAAYVDFKSTTTLTGYGDPRLLQAATVTGSFFSVLGVTPAAGRVFRDDETWSGDAHVVIISHRMWMQEFGGTPDLIGRTITLRGNPRQVVGVLPAGFTFPGIDADVWYPTEFSRTDRAQLFFRRAHWLRAFARLRDGVSRQAANAELQTVVRRLQVEYPATNTHMGASMTPLHDFFIGDTREPLLILLTGVVLLLLIACANVGNLLLVQAAAREREVAVRVALGAGRARLVRQAFTESLVLSAIGGAAGLVFGSWGTQALVALHPAGMLPVGDVHVSGHVVAYVLAVATISGLLFGVAPAVWNGRRAPSDALKEGSRGEAGGLRVRRWSEALVVSEVAIALLLSLGAGLLVRSFMQLERVDPGFNPAGVLAVSIDLPGARYDSTAKVTAFFNELVRRARTAPGAESAALVSALPLTGPSWSSDFSVEGRAVTGNNVSDVLHREISPDYPTVMRVKLISGRLFTDADRRGAGNVVLINEAMAKRYFRGENPIGQRVAFDRVPDSTSTWRTIVGVVGSERQAGVASDPRPEFLAPCAQDVQGAMTLVVRTRGDPMSLVPAVRRIVAELDRNLAITRIRTMSEVRAASLARDRFLTTLLLVFAAVGLALAVVGVYGVTAQLARSRTREMGIRLALGAESHHLQWLVVRRGLLLTAAGVALGLGGAFVGTRAMTALLFQVAPVDPLTFFATSALLVLAAAAASWIPARRAARADPMQALRAQ
jgi:putative ABC transport system permease protein